MVANHPTPANEPKQARPPEELKKHLLSFFISVALTVIAFIAVAFDVMSTTGLVLFLIGMAVIQAVFQLVYWMHLHQKDHEHPIIFMLAGGLVAVITVVSLVIWIWW